MEDAFHKVVEHIFNNWTALQLAVEHSMGGPNSKQIAVESVQYIVNYAMSENLESEDFEDVLEDIMDREFNTLCEDNSIAEVSQVLYMFLQLIKQGKVDEYNTEYAKLPVRPQWISTEAPEPRRREPAAAPEPVAESAEAESMDAEDSEWTQVKSRKKR